MMNNLPPTPPIPPVLTDIDPSVLIEMVSVLFGSDPLLNYSM